VIIGHEQTRISLSLRLKNNPDGVFLFHGPSCVGKKKIALDLIRKSFCGGDDSCKCQSCSLILSDKHPDILCIGTFNRIKVSDVDSILEFMLTAPLLSDRKAVIANNADKMTMGSINRMLNLLEGSKTGIFFLITDNLSQLPVTIVSRCEKYEFNRLNKEQYAQIIHKNLGYDKNKSAILGNLAAELPIDILSNAGLCLKYRTKAFEFFSDIKKRELIDVLEETDQIDREDLSLYIDMLIIISTDLLMLKNNYPNIVNKDMEDKLVALAKNCNDRALLWSVNTLSQVKKYSMYGINLNMALKNALIKTYPLLNA